MVLTITEGCTSATPELRAMLAIGTMSRIEIEIQPVVERRIDCVHQTDQKKRVAVCGRTHDSLGAGITARAGPILDEELLTEAFRQPLSRQARNNVGRATSWKANDNPHRPRRVRLRLRDAWQSR